MSSQRSATPRLLVLGGTTEASLLARALAEAGANATFSYAGRTHSPIAQPLPTRTGGFGGVAGLVAWVRGHRITHLVDATHPFAAQMSTHAVAACAATGVRLVALERPAWRAQAGDDWRAVPDIEAAVSALPEEATQVFLAIGRQNLAAFARRPQHRYLLRLVDEAGELPLARAAVVYSRGPFTVEGDQALMREHRITHVVAKNSGGSGGAAKLEAARRLGLPVVVIERPPVPARPRVATVGEALAWVAAHPADLGE